ncbi:MAG: DUF1365 domain-containing protein, partial [Opitutaceae bacterium]|nr:DUF1365 domain-containing protein [Opitutaceae bacterium]
MHARLHPRPHRFAYRIFLLEIDLDELPRLAGCMRLLRFDRPGLLSLRQRDYLPTNTPLHNPSAASDSISPGISPRPTDSDSSLKARVLALLATRGIVLGPAARVRLLTLPRVFGYQFNPVSFYFVSDTDGRPVASIAEVTNTFRETKCFVLGP